MKRVILIEPVNKRVLQSGKMLQLNSQQKAAVTYIRGPLLIIAGAGTGKTTVITERIKWLIEKGHAQPGQILALTFTEKAAREMEERVDQVLPLGYVQTWIATFHSFCERILRQEAFHLQLNPDFRILTEAQSYLFLKNHLFELPLDYYRPLNNPTKFLRGLLTHFNRLRDENISPQEYQKFSQKNHSDEYHYLELAETYRVYQELKKEAGVMDFADLVFYTLQLFQQRPAILNKYQQQFRFILLDEFQDTNYLQNEIAILLAGKEKMITAVCDDDQSIYRWRGAALYNVLDFKKHFPEAKIITLTQNYRSSQIILDRAYHFIQQNNPYRLEIQEKIDKKLKAASSVTGPDIQVIWTNRVEEEAEAVAQQINALLKKEKNLKLDQIALLVRANKHATPFTQALERYQIPYQFSGPGKLLLQPEIKNLTAYLHFLFDPYNSVALYRLLLLPYWHFNKRDLTLINAQARRNNKTLWEMLGQIKNIAGLTKETYSQSEKIYQLLNRLLALVPDHSPGELVYQFLLQSGLLQYYQDPQSALQDREIKNIARFFDYLKAFEVQQPESDLGSFLEYLDFLINEGESPRASEIEWLAEEAVHILTFHAAKGLEFEVVFLLNLVETRFPSRQRREPLPLPAALIKEPQLLDDPHLAEERRLFYVGMTRAKKYLFFTGARFYYENKKPRRFSPFVYEVLGKDLTPFLVPLSSTNQLSLLHYQKDTALTPNKEIPTLSWEKGRLSFSQINTYEICPLQYKYRYQIKIPEPPAVSLIFGDVIHRTLAEFYRRHSTGEKLTLTNLLEILEQFWQSYGYPSRAAEKVQKKEAEKMLDHYYQNFYHPQQQVLKIELPFTVNVGHLRISGRIDRIDQLANGEIEIIDYKTGRSKKPSQVTKDIQLTLYAWALTQPAVMGIPLEKQKLSFIFLPEGKKISVSRDENDLAILEKKIIQTWEKIAAQEFPPQPGIMCNYCPFTLLCPYFKGTLKY